MHIFFGAEKPTHMVRTYPCVKYMEYPPRDQISQSEMYPSQNIHSIPGLTKFIHRRGCSSYCSKDSFVPHQTTNKPKIREGLNIVRIPRSIHIYIYIYIYYGIGILRSIRFFIFPIYMSYYQARLVTCRLYATVSTGPVTKSPSHQDTRGLITGPVETVA